MADAGANQYTFHIEATDDPQGCVRKIKETGMKVMFFLLFNSHLNSSFFCGKANY